MFGGRHGLDSPRSSLCHTQIRGGTGLPQLVPRHPAELARRWLPWLTGQDRQRWRPHVTVQNKVEPEVARRLHADLSAAFTPYDAVAGGWRLFRYRGGPWEHVLDVPFEPAARAQVVSDPRPPGPGAPPGPSRPW